MSKPSAPFPSLQRRPLQPLPPQLLFPPLPSAGGIHRICCSIRCSSSPSPSPSSAEDTPAENRYQSLVSRLLYIPDWADAVQERGMLRPRPLYNADKWREHRSSRRHVRHLFSSLSSRVILSLVPPVAAFTAIAALIATYNSAIAAGWLPPGFPVLRASPLPYQLTAPAIALLLVFRTEASYARYVEGRKVWMGVMSGTSELAAMVRGIRVIDGSEDAGTKKSLLNYILAFPIALKCYVISGSNIQAELHSMLQEEDLAIVSSSNHPPRCIIEFILQSIQIMHIENTKRNLLEAKLSCFHESIGVCEQLMGIPIPLSYTRLTSRLLVLWHLTLPVILWDDCNWIVVPATFISAASLFCIEEVGVLIEEPFPMLSLDELCRQLHRNIHEAVGIESSIKDCVLEKRKKHMKWESINGRHKH